MKKFVVICIICLLFSGCGFLDPYKDSKYAVNAVYSWFSYNKDGVNLGEERRKLEEIGEIKDVKCKYVEHDSLKHYIYKCNIVFTLLDDTVIPLKKDEEKDVFVALTYLDDLTYNYIVYNSSYEEGVWEKDSSLGYKK